MLRPYIQSILQNQTSSNDISNSTVSRHELSRFQVQRRQMKIIHDGRHSGTLRASINSLCVWKVWCCWGPYVKWFASKFLKLGACPPKNHFWPAVRERAVKPIFLFKDHSTLGEIRRYPRWLLLISMPFIIDILIVLWKCYYYVIVKNKK